MHWLTPTSRSAKMAAIKQSMAYVEFTPEGEVVDANTRFLTCMGYTLDEIKKQSHRIFCSKSFLK